MKAKARTASKGQAKGRTIKDIPPKKNPIGGAKTTTTQRPDL